MKNFLTILLVFGLVQIGFGQSADTLLFSLKGEVFCDYTKKHADSTQVKIVGTDGSYAQTFTDSSGSFNFELKPNTSYSIVISKYNHMIAKGKETTVGLENSKIFYHEYKIMYNPGCPIALPMLSFEHNSTTPIYIENLTPTNPEYLYEILIENPYLVVEVKGYRDESEKKNVSKKRAQRFVKEVLSYGLDKNRIKYIDGGLGGNREISKKKDPHRIPNPFVIDENRLLTTKVVSTNYQPSNKN